jgi:S-adenosylmethionine synthetase
VNRRLVTAESVTEGHPDKVADIIADTLVDNHLQTDPGHTIACDIVVTTGLVVVAGHLSPALACSLRDTVTHAIATIGYSESVGFSARQVMVAHIAERSTESTTANISPLTARGFACDETVSLMPLPAVLAHALSSQLAQCRHNGTIPYLRPDGKTQVTVAYPENEPPYVHNVLISSQHEPEIDHRELQQAVTNAVIRPVLPPGMRTERTLHLVNPTPRFVFGGPAADTGLTGRKLAVDSYGGIASHGGNVLSGRDPRRASRLLTYAARWMARNVVSAGYASRCSTLLVSEDDHPSRKPRVYIDCHGTNRLAADEILSWLRSSFEFDLFELAACLAPPDLNYRRTAAYGHFGRPNEMFPWETAMPVRNQP